MAKTCEHPGCNRKFPPSALIGKNYYCLEHACEHLPKGLPKALFEKIHKPETLNGKGYRTKSKRKSRRAKKSKKAR